MPNLSNLVQEPEALKIQDRQGNIPEELAEKHKNAEAVKLIKAGPLQEESEFSKKLLASFRKG